MSQASILQSGYIYRGIIRPLPNDVTDNLTPFPYLPAIVEPRSRKQELGIQQKHAPKEDNGLLQSGKPRLGPQSLPQEAPGNVETGPTLQHDDVVAATRLVEQAEHLANKRRVHEAEHLFVQAAEQYLATDDKLAALRYFLRAIDLVLTNSLMPELARILFNRADQVARDDVTVDLRFELVLAHARYAFATLSDNEAQTLLVQAKELILDVDGDQERTVLWHKLGIQYATFAMVWESWDVAHQILNEALAACPSTMPRERLDLLFSLLHLSTERGDWDVADSVYLDAQTLLAALHDPKLRGLLSMHYASSLARRGDLENAYPRFVEAIQQLDISGDAFELWQTYDNMSFMLLRNGASWFIDMDEYERRKLDLYRIVENQNQSVIHEEAAISDLNERSYRAAFKHLRLALAYYHRTGQWSGIERVYRLLSNLWAATSDPVEALLAAIRGADKETAEQQSDILSNIGSEQQLVEVIDDLLNTGAGTSERQAALRALGMLADVMPKSHLERTIHHLSKVLNGSGITRQQDDMRRYAAEALRNVVPQCSSQQTGQIIHLVLDELNRDQSNGVVEELLKLLNTCITTSYVDPALHSMLADTLLHRAQTAQGIGVGQIAERAAVHLARIALPDVREQIVTYIRSQLNNTERLGQLAYLNEPIPADQLKTEIDRILRAIKPQPKIITTDGTSSKTIPMSGVVPSTLLNYDDLLTPLLGDSIITGLLDACQNEDTPLWVRNDALRTLAALPATLLRNRADELVDPLLRLAQGSLPLSSLIQWELASQANPFSNVRVNMGNLEEVRRSALTVLGHLYGFITSKHREDIDTYLIVATHDESAIVRQGVAMALEAIEYDGTLARHILTCLFVLLADPVPTTRAWTCPAVGHTVGRGLAGIFASDLFEELLSVLQRAHDVEEKVGGVISLRSLVENHWPDASARQRIMEVLDPCTGDVSFRVRKQAVNVVRLLAITAVPESPRGQVRAALQAAGLLTELAPNLRRQANPFTIPEQVQEAMERAGKEPLSEFILAEREMDA